MMHRGSNGAAQHATDDTAEYLAAMCDQLAAIAERDGLKVGAYLLKMAQLEFAGQAEAPTPTDHATR